MSKKAPLKQRGSTLFLRAALLGISGLVAFFGTFLLMSVYSDWDNGAEALPWLRWSIFIAILLVILSFYTAGLQAWKLLDLFDRGKFLSFYTAGLQAWKLLDLFDRGKAFSQAAVRSLNIIKYCAFAIGALLALFMPLIWRAAEQDDAPGLILFGLGFVCVPLAVAVFAGVLQKILQNAIDLKSENDLTV